MSDVDKRVVQMDFDNKKFEKNVKQSTESLNTLKSSLNFDGVSNSIDQVTVKISKMEMVVASVISNITNRIVNLGIQLVKSLSIDNIAAGWAKFGQKTTSVATLMAQTLKVSGQELTDSIEKLATVNDLMDRLMWFTDETSYSFTDMIDNIGKFTAAGLDLDVSAKAMEGIATWAALSGQNATTASRAMYQLSQAMGKGKIQLIDWKSIQNANMDTAEMRKNVLETAVSLGQLTKEGDKYVTKSGKKFTQNQFTEELSEGWFTSEVLTTTLKKYSDATDEIYAIAQKEGLTASEVLAKYGDTLDEFGVKAFKAAQEARTFSDALNSIKDAVASKWMTTSELIFGDKDEAIELWTDLANALYEVFAESGDFRNSILEVWKSLGGHEDLFKRGGDDQGAFWNIFDAIVAVKNVIKQAWNTIFPLSEMQAESDQAQDIGNSLKALTLRFQAFTKTIKLSEVNALRLRKVLEGVFTIFKGLLKILYAVKYILEPVVDLIKKLIAAGIDKLISLMGKFNISGEWLVKVTDKIHDALEKAFEVVSDFVKEYVSIDKIRSAFAKLRQEFIKLVPILDKIKSAFVSFGERVKNIATTVVDAIKEFLHIGAGENVDNQVIKPVKKSLASFSKVAAEVTDTTGEDASSSKNGLLWGLVDLFRSLYDLLSSIVDLTSAIIFLVSRGIKNLAEILKTLAEGAKVVAGVTEVSKETTNNLEDWKKYMEGWQGTLIIIATILVAILTIIVIIRGVYYSIQSVMAPLQTVCDSLAGYLDKLGMSSVLSTLGHMVLEIAAALLIIASIDPSRLWPAVAVLGIISVIFAGIVVLTGQLLKSVEKASAATSDVIMEIRDTSRSIRDSIAGCFDEISGTISEAKKLMKMQTLATTIRAFGSAMMQVAMALYIIGQIDTDQLWLGALVMVTMSAMIMMMSQYAKACGVKIQTAMPGLLQMITFAVVVRVLGKTLLMFKDVSWEQMAVMGVAAAALLTFMKFCLVFLTASAVISKIADPKETSKTIGQLYAISLLVFSFALSAKILASVDWNTLGITLGIVGGFISEFAGLMLIIATANKVSEKEMKSAMGQMLAMALLLFSFALSAKILSTIDWSTMAVTMGVIGGFFVEFAGMIALLNLASNLANDKTTQNASPLLLSMSLGIFAFGLSAKILSTIDWNTLGVVMGVIGGFFVEFAGMVALMNLATKLGVADLDKSAKMILALSSLMVSFGIMAKMTSRVDYGKLWSAVGGLSVVMIAMSTLFAAIALAASQGMSAKEGTGLMISISGLFVSFAASMALLSIVDTGKLYATFGALALTIGIFAALAVTLATVKGAISGAKTAADALLKFSYSLAIVAASLFVLAIMPWQRTLGAAGALALALGIFAGIAVSLGATKGALEAAKGAADALFKFSYSLAIVAASLFVLAIMPWQRTLGAAGALALALGIFAGIAVSLGATKGALEAAKGAADALFKFSYSLAIVAASLFVLAIMPWDHVLASMGALVLTLGTFAGTAVTLSRVSGSLGAATDAAGALRKFAIDIAIVSASLFVLAIQPWSRLLAAASAIAIVMSAFVGLAVSFAALPGAASAAGDAAVSLGIFGAALIPLGISLAIVASQPWQGILSAALAIVAVVSTLVGAVTLMEMFGIGGQDFLVKMAALSLGLVMFSGAMIIFAQAFKTFDSVDWMSILKALVSIAGGIIILGVAAALTKNIIPAILALGAAFVLIGFGMILAATAIQMVASSILNLTSMSSEQLAAISAAISTFSTLLTSAFAPIISALISELTAAMPQIFELADVVIKGILNLLSENLPTIIDLVVDTVDKIMTALSDHSESICSSISEIISDILEMFKENVGDWAQDIVDIIIDIMGVISNKDNIDKVVKEVLAFLTNFFQALIDNQDMIDKLFNTVMEFVKLLLKKLTAAAIELAGMLSEVLLIVIAAAIRILIASLGALSKLFVTLVGSVLLILAHTVSGLSNTVLEVFKVIVKELLKGAVEAILWAQDVFAALGILVMQLIARGLISVVQSRFGWLFDIIDKIFGTSIADELQEISDGLGDMARNTVNKLEAGTDRVQNSIKTMSSNINGVIAMTAEEANSALTDGMNQIGEAVTNSKTLLKTVTETGEDMVDGFTNGINNNLDKTEEAGENMGGSVEDGTRKKTKTHSPSRVFYELGSYVVAGFANGINDNSYTAVDGMTSMVSRALTAAQDTLDSQNGDDLTIKVGMDISGVEEQSRNIASIMSGVNNVTATAYGRNASYNSSALNKGSSGGTVNTTDNSTSVTYNNVINVTSTDPERSADEIDRALSRQATMAKLARGAV